MCIHFNAIRHIEKVLIGNYISFDHDSISHLLFWLPFLLAVAAVPPSQPAAQYITTLADDFLGTRP